MFQDDFGESPVLSLWPSTSEATAVVCRHFFSLSVSKQLHKETRQEIILGGREWSRSPSATGVSCGFGQPLQVKGAQLSNLCAAAPLLWTGFPLSPQHAFINNYRKETKMSMCFCSLSSVWCYTSFPSCLCADLSV